MKDFHIPQHSYLLESWITHDRNGGRFFCQEGLRKYCERWGHTHPKNESKCVEREPKLSISDSSRNQFFKEK